MPKPTLSPTPLRAPTPPPVDHHAEDHDHHHPHSSGLVPHVAAPVQFAHIGNDTGYWLFVPGVDGSDTWVGVPYAHNAQDLDITLSTGQVVEIRVVNDGEGIYVGTTYTDGKPYQFIIWSDHSVEILKW